MDKKERAIKVLIVDDSQLIRNVLRELLSRNPKFEVVGAAVDPYDAREKIKSLQPDVITLDIEMPKMDGVTFLRNLMKLNPMPVVMLSTLTHEGADATLKALELGAVDFIAKPRRGASDDDLTTFSRELCDKIEVAAANYQRLKFRSVLKKVEQAPHGLGRKQWRTVIAVGASTGGVEAVKTLLAAMPLDCPPIVITQHIPENFSQRFADRLNAGVAIDVKQAEQGDTLCAGCAYIAPGAEHLQLIEQEGQLHCALNAGDKVNRHRPAVDVMFDSLVGLRGWSVIPVLLTGMGGDGAAGMKRLVDAGAISIVQDQQSSVIWGMPGEAVRLGAASYVLPLNEIAQQLVAQFNK
ncbi:MAG: protein-glutamate methylesterase/protein-glutamine glutaminase [Pseudomonadales bacterium]